MCENINISLNVHTFGLKALVEFFVITNKQKTDMNKQVLVSSYV